MVFKKSAYKSAHWTLAAAILVLLSSIFLIGGWHGMGIGAISLGMFISSAALYSIHFFASLKSAK